jgi:hypothetical protein
MQEFIFSTTGRKFILICPRINDFLWFEIRTRNQWGNVRLKGNFSGSAEVQRGA